MSDNKTDAPAVDYATVNEALEAFAKGSFVIVTDNEDRENEGDLILGAEFATEDNIAFLLRYSTGIVCVPMEGERLEALELEQMVQKNTDAHETAFTVTVDVKEGTTTGVSAFDRAATIRALADDKLEPSDLRRPGHIFPLRARPGGVLMRAGHTEAAVDLARLSGIKPVATICEMMNDEGVMMKTPELAEFSKEHNIPFITIGQLIEYRRARDKLIERTADDVVETRYGKLRAVQYLSPIDGTRHMAFVKGTPTADTPTVVRVHRLRGVLDLIGYKSDLVSDTFDMAMNAIAQSESGIMVILSNDFAPSDPRKSVFPTEADIKEHRSADENAPTKSWRETGIGSQIIRDLGARKLRILASSEYVYTGVHSFGLEITEPITLSDYMNSK